MSKVKPLDGLHNNSGERKKPIRNYRVADDLEHHPRFLVHTCQQHVERRRDACAEQQGGRYDIDPVSRQPDRVFLDLFVIEDPLNDKRLASRSPMPTARTLGARYLLKQSILLAALAPVKGLMT